MKLHVGLVIALFLALFASGQTSGSSPASVSVPPVIQFSNVAVDPAGNPLTGTVPITFSLYNNAEGGEALWTETQSITLDSSGRYSVYLGITKKSGLPVTLFTTGQALWLGVQVAGETEQQRAALVSVPYAMKAGDAATVGGLPPSAFVMANSPNHPSGKKANPASETQNYIPLFIDNSGDLGNSILFQSGTTEVGIGTTTPSATLEVNGTAKFDAPVSFVSGQTFPGTLTGIKAGTGITVSGSTTDPTVGINTTFANQYYAQLAAANTFTKSQTVNGTVTATQLISNVAQGTAPLQVTSNTVVPNLDASFLGGMAASAFQPAGSYAITNGANNFSGNQSVTGNVSATGSISGGASTFTGLVTESGALLPSTGTATASQGYDSNAMDLVASAYNSTAGQAQNQDFQWLVAPAGNDTNSPSGTLTLLFGENGAPPMPTGLSIASSGQITFAQNQSFPNVGTITGVSGSNGITGGGTSGNVTLSLASNSCPSNNALTALPFTCSPFATLGGNAFNGNQTVTGNLTASGTVQGAVVQALDDFVLGGAPFVQGANYNTLVGFYLSAAGQYNTASGYEALQFNTAGSQNTVSGSFALEFNQTGSGNTASGYQALLSNSAGSYNVASGYDALFSNTTGAYNTASGYYALQANQTGGYNSAYGYHALYGNTSGSNDTAIGRGTLFQNTTGNTNTAIGYLAGETADSSAMTQSNNTFVGASALASTGTLTNATAIGANAEVSESNAIVLGSIGGINGATNSAMVGVGTNAPGVELDVFDQGTGVAIRGLSVASNGVGVNGQSGGSGGVGVYGSANGSGGLAGYFEGNVTVTGTLSKGGGSFKIDHPLDPANKYLYHSFVESPDMMNIYNGVITLDAHGAAWITLPDYFEALNRDFRYQLTSMGRPQPNLYVAREISGNRFRISGGKPGGKVSWQVTGIRHDAYADAHRIPVEEEKPPQEQGRYLHPELFGAPPEMAIGHQPRPSAAVAKAQHERMEGAAQ